MPIRQISKNYRSLTGQFPSLKNKRLIAFESLLERDFYLTLEFNKEVTSYEEQPIKLYYQMNNKKTRYTPDTLVHYHEYLNKKPCIYEVKYADELKQKKVFFKEKFDQIEKYLFENDMDFKIFTNQDIEPVFLENIRFIYGYSNYTNEKVIDDTLQKLKTFKDGTINDFLNFCSSNKYEQNEIIPYFWKNLILENVELDLYKRIDRNTTFEVLL